MTRHNTTEDEMDDHTIETTKGSRSGTLREVCAWQAEMQGAYATIDGVDVNGVDFDAEDLDATIDTVADVLRESQR